MQDQGNKRQYQQNVNKRSRHVKDGEPANPCDEQDDKKHCPDTHKSLHFLFRQLLAAFTTVRVLNFDDGPARGVC